MSHGGKRLLFGWLVWPFVIGGVLWTMVVHADDVMERRIQISLPIFPRIVAVDNNFDKKLLPKQKALFVFIYDANKGKAEQLSESLKHQLTNVAGLEFTSIAISVQKQLAEQTPVPTALFVAELLPNKAFSLMVEYSVSHHRILFSPFAGDVERGATAGISITSRVKPYFNIKTLQRSDIDINAVLMNLSKRYE